MEGEMNSLKKKYTCDLVGLPKGRKALENKCVFKLKKDGSQIIKYKARVMVKECARKKGADLSEIFSLAVKMRSI